MEIKEYDLPGLRTYDLKLIPDERGFFAESFRQDWAELIGDDQIVQVNASFSYPGMIRAWHRHLRGQVDYFLVLKGALKICAYDNRDDSPATKGKLVEIITSAHKPQLVRMPGIYWHGSKNISNEPSLLIYYVTKLYDYQDPDEERRPWNDLKIIDPMTGKSYDWNRLPNR